MSKTEAYTTGVEGPLTTGEVADFALTDYTFIDRPRALNCSAAGVLVVDLGDLVEEAITVTAGINPYRVTKIYTAGSDALTVVGMS